MAAYGRIKARIFTGCQHAVVNRDDAAVMALAPNGATTFGLSEPAADQYGLREVDGQKWLCRGESRITNHESLKIIGLPNAANALAALALADAAGIAREANTAALRAFGGFPHCCAFVSSTAGVNCFIDLQGSNVRSPHAAR